MEPISTVCIICNESYNKRNRSKIICQYCPFESCRLCCQTYILNETFPKCMDTSCNREWTRQFLKSNFTKMFLNKEYKFHRERVLFDHERSLLPATQPLVEREIQRDRLIFQINEKRRLVRKIKGELRELDTQYFRFINHRTNNENQRNAFIRACPIDNCRGFLNSQWKCGLCENWTCPQCNEIIGLDKNIVHECNPENVLTANLISRDTKSCPKCGTGIFKIDGCDQMFCTICNTGFSWRTGQIENRVIHNPHYFEWIRRNNNNNNTIVPENNVCDNHREILNGTILNLNSLFLQKRIAFPEKTIEINDTNKILLSVCRNIIHLRRVVIPNYIDNSESENRELRIKYMRNYIDEDNFKSLIQKNNKKNEKKRELNNIFQMVHDSIRDYIFQFISDLRSEHWNYDLSIVKNIEAILSYANECLLDISEIYDSKRISFSNEGAIF